MILFASCSLMRKDADDFNYYFKVFMIIHYLTLLYYKAVKIIKETRLIVFIQCNSFSLIQNDNKL